MSNHFIAVDYASFQTFAVSAIIAITQKANLPNEDYCPQFCREKRFSFVNQFWCTCKLYTPLRLPWEHILHDNDKTSQPINSPALRYHFLDVTRHTDSLGRFARNKHAACTCNSNWRLTALLDTLHADAAAAAAAFPFFFAL